MHGRAHVVSVGQRAVWGCSDLLGEADSCIAWTAGVAWEAGKRLTMLELLANGELLLGWIAQLRSSGAGSCLWWSCVLVSVVMLASNC